MHVKKLAFLIGAIVLIATLAFAGIGLAQGDLSPKEELGMNLYFDENLSHPDGQSCASCHDPDFGFVDPDKGIPVSEGVIPGLFGSRNSPMSAYAMYAPALHFDTAEELWIGGQFWDGRATGLSHLGDPLADQAVGPPLNPVEMANPSKAAYIADIVASDYALLFEEVWGPGSLDDIETAYDQAGLSVAAFERTELFAQFSSKYDYYLSVCMGMGYDPGSCALGTGDAAAVAQSIFTKKEYDGFQLFMNGENDNDGILQEGEGAACVLCHIAEWTTEADYDLPVVVPDWAPEGMIPPVFTDFTFDNLGVPKSDHPLLKDLDVDNGLGDTVGDPAENGKFKVMTVRNIHLTAPYAHNGFFKQLEDITHFYNTRDALGDCSLVAKPKVGKNCWPAPEFGGTMNTDELGDLGLSENDEDALVKFMKTLTDGWWMP